MNKFFDYKSSYTKKVFDYLFAPGSYFVLSEGRLGNLVSRLRQPLISEVLLLTSLLLVIYQQLLPQQIRLYTPFLVIISLLFTNKDKLKIGKNTFWLIVFYMSLTISAVYAIISGLNPTMVISGWLLWLQFGLFVVAAMTVNVKRITRWLTWSIAPVSLIGIVQFFTTKTTTLLWVSEFEQSISFRAYSIVEDPNIFGMLSALGLIAAVALLLSKKKKYLLLTPIFILAIILSFSRTTWLSLCLVAIIIVFIRWRKYLLVTPLGLFALFIPKVRERILVSFNPDFLMASSIDGRIWILNNVIYLWKQRPILGFGPGSYGGEIAYKYASPVYHLGIQGGFVPIYYSDSSWLQLLVQSGIIGVMTLFGFFVSAAMQISQTIKKSEQNIYLGGLAALIFVAVASITSNIIEFGTVIIPFSLLIGSALYET